jgi:hypothetical protein
MGPADISTEWRMEFLARLVNVPRNDRAPASYHEFAKPHGPTLTWLQQFLFIFEDMDTI